MLHLIISILGIILTILFVIGTHEAAHFGMAKWLGVKVLRFSIGFGKPIVTWHDHQGTEYVIAPIPLGGYVKMLDETEDKVKKEELPLAYNRQPYYKKFLIVLAGPLSNFICAIILYWLIFIIGFVSVKPVIGHVTTPSIAASAGLKPNQQITAIDNSDTHSWQDVIFRLLNHMGNSDRINMTVLDASKSQTLSLDVSHWKMGGLMPDPLSSLGIIPYEPEVPMVIGIMLPDSPAAKSGLKIGDKIIAIGKQKIGDWMQLIDIITNNPDQTMSFQIERDSKPLTLNVTIGAKRNWLFKKYGSLGIAPKIELPKSMLQTIHYGPLAAVPEAFREVFDLSYFNLLLIGKMITGKLSLQGLGGPITIFESAGNALNSGMLSFISFLAFLSISIGLINFFPIPGLDGGHLLIQTIETLIRRPIPEKILVFLFRCGFLFIIFILLDALTNDILRLM